MKLILRTIVILLLAAAIPAQEPGYRITDLLTGRASTPSRSLSWQPGAGLAMEVSGMDWTEDGRLAVAIRKGEVWLIDGLAAESGDGLRFTRFASGLHEPLGLLRDGDSFLVTQRTELTRLRDTDGDDVADEYLCEATGWNVSGAYHGYAYGPRRDGRGDLWMSLNLDMGEHTDNTKGWRGWAGLRGAEGSFVPMAAGMRSPCGLGANREGDMFCVDQQGTWIPTTPIYHLRRGVFFLNPEGIGSQNLPGSPLRLSGEPPNRVPYPEALGKVLEMRPPAVWLPYNKMGRSGTDIALCDQGGRFGPFDGQLFVGEFTDAGVNRVFLEKVEGEYQGAAFPFLSGFASGVVRLRFGPDGCLYVGMSNRGWSSLGTRAYGLQRVRWEGETSFAILEMHAKPDGFELLFTQPVDAATASEPASYSFKSYTYLYSNAYGSPEIETQNLKVVHARVSPDRLRVRLGVEGLRPLYVHELRAEGVVSGSGTRLAHPDAYYTLNRIPREP